MKSLILYSSLSGNTKKIAEAIAREVEDAELLSIREVQPAMLSHFDVIYLGYWVDKGDCDQLTRSMMSHLQEQRIVLFGTTGASRDAVAYYDKIKVQVESHLHTHHLLGHFLCQGKVSEKLIDRYRMMLREHPEDEHLKQQVVAYESGQAHPDEEDIREAVQFVRSIG